jgi:hypothetical protein
LADPDPDAGVRQVNDLLIVYGNEHCTLKISPTSNMSLTRFSPVADPRLAVGSYARSILGE